MAAFDETLVVTDPDNLGYSVNPASYVAGVEEILIFTGTRTIALKVFGNLLKDGATIKAVYSKLKDAWRADADLIKFPFPMGPITDEQFEMVNGWNWDFVGSTGITISAATWAATNGGEITYTTGAAHGIAIGDSVTVAGVTPTGYNGTYTAVTGTTGSTLVVAATATTPGTYTSGGTITNYLLSTDLLRTGGWSVVNTGGVIDELWTSVVSLGSLGTTDQVYYQQLDSDEASVNFKLTGKVNQAVRIYYFDGTGSRINAEDLTDSFNGDGYVYRRYFKMFVREWQKLYAQSEIADIGVSKMTYQAYRFPLTNATDLKVTHTEAYVGGVATLSGTSTGAVATINTAVPHGLTTGDFVIIEGVTPAGYNKGGVAAQITVTDTDTFTYAPTGSDIGPITVQGTIQKSVYNNVNITYLRHTTDALYTVRGDYTDATMYAVADVVRDASLGTPTWFKNTGAAATSSGATLSADVSATTWVAYEGERLIGTSWYAFTTIIDADTTVAPTASGAARTAEIYEIVQYYLRQNSDIDFDATATVTGKTASSLLKFVGDTLVTSSGVYVDSFNTTDTNAIEFFDYAGASRTFPFVAALTINFGTNLQNDSFAKFWVFFTNDDAGSNTARDFGTINAIIVQDAAGGQMTDNVSARTNVTYSYNYDSNDQRGVGTYNSGDGIGDSAKTNAPITVVGIGLSTGQYVTATGSIARSIANSVTLTASLERNYEE